MGIKYEYLGANCTESVHLSQSIAANSDPKQTQSATRFSQVNDFCNILWNKRGAHIIIDRGMENSVEIGQTDWVK